MDENLIVDCPHCGEENEIVVTFFSDNDFEVKEEVSCFECHGVIDDATIDMDNRVVIFE